jgi:hypothetical protein
MTHPVLVACRPCDAIHQRPRFRRRAPVRFGSGAKGIPSFEGAA